MTVRTEERGAASQPWTTPWRELLVSLGLSVAGTACLGGGVFVFQRNAWWIAGAGVLSLFGGGMYLGRARRNSEPLNGVLLAILYFGLVVAVLFGGTLTDSLPDPLPGLGVGDSTLFFVWPLLQLAAGVLGSIIGGRSVQEDLRRSR